MSEVTRLWQIAKALDDPAISDELIQIAQRLEEMLQASQDYIDELCKRLESQRVA